MSDLNTVVTSVISKTVGSIPLSVQQKRMTKSEWSRSSVILRPGEIGIETDTGYGKAGDGVSRFANLPYLAPASTGATTSVGIQRSSVEYASHTSGTQAPSSGWSTDIPTVPSGQYLWTRITLTLTDGQSVVSYSVARQGKDGASGGGTTNTSTGSSYVAITHVREESQATINGYTPGTLKIFYLHSNTNDFNEGDTVIIPIKNTDTNTDGHLFVKVTDKYSIGYLRGTIVKYYGDSASPAAAGPAGPPGPQGPTGPMGPAGPQGAKGNDGTSVTAQIKTKSQYDGMYYKDPNVLYIIKEG